MGNASTKKPSSASSTTPVAAPTVGATATGPGSDTDAVDNGPHPIAAISNQVATYQSPPVLPPVTSSTVMPSHRRGVLDARGIERGLCTRCDQCVGYNPLGGGEGGPAMWKCINCNCVPGVHEKLTAVQAWHMVQSAAPVPHYHTQQPAAGPTFMHGQPDQYSVPPTAPASGPQICAIDECSLPCFVDSSGVVHDCCGFTHAMEYKRRQGIQQQQQVNKGVTHCLLPECSRLVWPFMNYCGRTHADIGIQRGLVPPVPQVDEKDKDTSLCIFPGCQKPRYVDGSTTHDFCGRYHAQQGKKMGITRTTDKEEEQCELPGCTRPKRQEGTTTHDYCCMDHANQDAPNRADVQKFLDGFKGTLKVVDIKENDAAKPGGALFKRFQAKWQSLPKNQRKTCLAFHGTAESNIKSICENGYDSSKRGSNVGQKYGAGEYFATNPSISLSYCAGKKIILNELLLGQSGTHHTRTGDIVVMKDPAHDLPRFVITFK